MLRPADFDLFKTMLYEKSGLVITPDKSYLLESRLAPHLKTWGLADMAALAEKLRKLPDKAIIDVIVDAMTTNETSFFRDMKPFDKFRDVVVPAILAKKGAGAPIKIWSAACSSGQEPYTLALTIKENALKWAGTKFDILATDLSTEILAQAKAATYTQFEVQRGMPIQLLIKYFSQNGDKWTVKDDLKQFITFQKFNLLDSMDHMGPFDIIFCRNVLIYFDQQTKGKVLEKMRKRLHPHGFLFLGGAETVLGITNAFKPMEGERGLYVPA